MRPRSLVAATVRDDPHALAVRYHRDGCLLLRGMLPPATTETLAGQAAAMLRRWDITDTAPRPGDLHATGTPLGDHDLVDLDTIPALTALIDRIEDPDHPLRHTVSAICGQPMRLWRNVRLFTHLPGDPTTITRPHRDAYTRTPTGDYRRLWIAITHIPFADNGLAVALGSHQTDPADTTAQHWHTAEFHPGDALLMHGSMLHRGLPATSDRIRIAMAIITSRDGDPRPPATFTAPECRQRNQRMREIATQLGLPEHQHIHIRGKLLDAGLPITESTVRSALPQLSAAEPTTNV